MNDPSGSGSGSGSLGVMINVCWCCCRFVKTAISFTQPIQRDKAPSTSYQYLWGTKVLTVCSNVSIHVGFKLLLLLTYCMIVVY